jgi:Ricin-type beta-trefoil lectin domain
MMARHYAFHSYSVPALCEHHTEGSDISPGTPGGAADHERLTSNPENDNGGQPVLFSKLPSVRSLIGLLGAASMVAFLGAIIPAQASILPVRASAAPAVSNFGTIGNYHSGKCLDDTSFRTVNSTWQEIWTCNYGSNQLWATIYKRSDGAVEIQDYTSYVRGGAGCLDLLGGSSANGAHVVIYNCNYNHSDDAELWYLEPTTIPGWYNLRNVASRTCMTVSGDSQANGAKIIGWSCSTAGYDHAYFWEPHF